MPMLTITPGGKTVEVPPGSTLLAGILAAGETLKTPCTGTPECTHCHVFVQEGKKSLSKAQRNENAMLDTIVGVGSKSRIACQAVIGQENVTVELLGFASG